MAIDRTYAKESPKKICNQCQQEKVLEDFPYQKGGKFGRLAYCKECHRQNSNSRYTYATYRERHLQRYYKIGVDEFEQLKKLQHSKCAICEGETLDLHVDHDHTTGKIRGLLCHGCNTGIGLLGDTKESLKKALAYLER